MRNRDAVNSGHDRHAFDKAYPEHCLKQSCCLVHCTSVLGHHRLCRAGVCVFSGLSPNRFVGKRSVLQSNGWLLGATQSVPAKSPASWTVSGSNDRHLFGGHFGDQVVAARPASNRAAAKAGVSHLHIDPGTGHPGQLDPEGQLGSPTAALDRGVWRGVAFSTGLENDRLLRTELLVYVRRRGCGYLARDDGVSGSGFLAEGGSRICAAAVSDPVNQPGRLRRAFLLRHHVVLGADVPCDPERLLAALFEKPAPHDGSGAGRVVHPKRPAAAPFGKTASCPVASSPSRFRERTVGELKSPTGHFFLGRVRLRIRANRNGDRSSTQVIMPFRCGADLRRLRRWRAALRLVPMMTTLPSAKSGTPVGIGNHTVARPSRMRTAASDHHRIFISAPEIETINF